MYPFPARNLSILLSETLFVLTCSFFHIKQIQCVPSSQVQSKPKTSQGIGSEDFGFEGQGMFLKETPVPEQGQSSGSGLFGLRENISPP